MLLLRRCITTVVVVLLCACSRSPHEQRDKYLRLGVDHFGKKDYARALLAFHSASKAMPGDVTPWYRLGMTALALGDALSGADFLEKALRIDANHLESQIELATLYVKSTDVKTLRRGIALAESAARLAPQDPRPLNLLAVADMRAGEASAAVARLTPLLQSAPAHLDTCLNLARARMLQRDSASARRTLDECVTRSSNDPRARFARADFLAGMGDAAAAVAEYEGGLRLAPEDGPALATLASLYARLGQDQKTEEVLRRLSSNRDKQFRFAHTDYLLSRQQPDAAIAELLNITQKDAADTEARTRLVNVYIGLDRHRQAEELLSKVIGDNPKDRDALIARGRMKLSEGDLASAERDITAALAIQSDSAAAHYLLAQVQQKRNRLALQKQELTETLRLDPAHAAARAELAALLTAFHDARAALSLIEAAPGALKEDIALALQRSWALIEGGEFARAREAVDSILARAPSSEVLLQDAALRAQARDWTGAVAGLSKVLSQTPGDRRAIELLYRVMQVRNQGRPDFSHLREHAARYPGLAPVQLIIGKLEMQAGDSERARTALEAAKRTDRSLTEADILLGDLDCRLGRPDQARTRWTSLLGGPADAQARRRLAELEYNAAHYEQSAGHYRRAVEDNGRDVTALNNLAYVLAEHLQRPDEALQYAQRAKELAPEDANVDDTLGWVYFRKGLYSAAISHLGAAVKRAPSPRKRLHLGLAYAKVGDLRRAAAELQAGLGGDPSWPEMALARRVASEMIR